MDSGENAITVATILVVTRRPARLGVLGGGGIVLTDGVEVDMPSMSSILVTTLLLIISSLACCQWAGFGARTRRMHPRWKYHRVDVLPERGVCQMAAVSRVALVIPLGMIRVACFTVAVTARAQLMGLTSSANGAVFGETARGWLSLRQWRKIQAIGDSRTRQKACQRLTGVVA